MLALPEVTGKLWKIFIYTHSIGGYYIKAVVGSIIAILRFSNVWVNCGPLSHLQTLTFHSSFPFFLTLSQEHIWRWDWRALGTPVVTRKVSRVRWLEKRVPGLVHSHSPCAFPHSSFSGFCKDCDASRWIKPRFFILSQRKATIGQEQPS